MAVLGLGPIGNLAAQLGFCAGAGSVTGFDFVEWRRVLAKKCGILRTEENGEDEAFDSVFDVVIEATGVPLAKSWQNTEVAGTDASLISWKANWTDWRTSRRSTRLSGKPRRTHASDVYKRQAGTLLSVSLG